MKIYVACLASYNNGILHGRWIDATSDPDEMQEAVDAMLRESPCPSVTVTCPECNGDGKPYGFGEEVCKECKGRGEVPSAEEWAIHDFDGIPSSLGEYCGLQAVADYVSIVEECEDRGEDERLARAMLDNWRDPDTAKRALEDDFVGVYETFRDYADNAADEMLACHTEGGKVPQMLVNYFDYDAFARDLALEMTVLDLPSGVAVFHQ